ncbi:hypothetical protein TCAL_02439 [Tigriopus californicus]|uniref:Uncharacterized protein n=1 Tax=Tigriopus californicus TaxID=6832 RepID=A0A553NY55_TIGCA|nr:CD63 antigen-like [Tigriopus californicus]TRY70348.1 hypothetical protein TCAL_02439 [Tigriopus californicus]
MRNYYPGLLVTFNVVLLLTSSIMLYLGISLVAYYKLDSLDFVSQWFWMVPYIMIILGLGVFVVALYGCAVGLTESRCQLYTFSGLMILFFILQLLAIFAAMELRSVILRAEFYSIDVLDDLRDYNTNWKTRAKWDGLHREYHCCGGVNFYDGFRVWRNADVGEFTNSVPDSCCLRVTEGCGVNVFNELEQNLVRKIHMHGCLTLMNDKLESQVVPMLLGYTGVGTILALVQLLCVIFACALAAAIKREMNEHDDIRSLRSSTNAGSLHGSFDADPATPRFDHSRRDQHHYGRDNLNAAYEAEQRSKIPHFSDFEEKAV